jgi:hypothetical protein
MWTRMGRRRPVLCCCLAVRLHAPPATPPPAHARPRPCSRACAPAAQLLPAACVPWPRRPLPLPHPHGRSLAPRPITKPAEPLMPPAEGEAAPSFGDLISQLLELVLALVGNQRYQALLRAQLHHLLPLTLGYMQMTAEKVRSPVPAGAGGGEGAPPGPEPRRLRPLAQTTPSHSPPPTARPAWPSSRSPPVHRLSGGAGIPTCMWLTRRTTSQQSGWWGCCGCLFGVCWGAEGS